MIAQQLLPPLRKDQYVAEQASCVIRILLVLVWSAALVILAGCEPQERVLEPVSERPIVFFGVYGRRDCNRAMSALEAGEYELSPAGSRIGYEISWPRGYRTPFEMFNLNTLRHLECQIESARQSGTAAGLEFALAAIRDWAAAHPQDDPASEWAWLEHATAWRSVMLAYVKRVDDDVSALSSDDSDWLNGLAIEHADQLARASIYTPHHNHGLNNSLGLMALGTAYDTLPDATEWIRLARRRAEQQMADNVSSDGVHLEQSGFYHYYTLRTFLELDRVARSLGHPMSAPYRSRLDKMLGVAASMADRDGTLRGMPYSAPDRDYLSDFLRGSNLLAPGPGRDAFDRVRGGQPLSRLTIYSEGGYSFLPASRPDDIRVIFHHRILDAPHAHQDALGISAAVNGDALILFPSSNSTGEGDWSAYFTGPWAHNTVQVEGLEQVPPARRRPGLLGTMFDSYKINRAVERIGLSDSFQSFRRKADLDRLPLSARLSRQGGEVVAAGENDRLMFVTARHRTYEGVTHTRTIARIDGRLLLVRDLLVADQERNFVQSFHFAPNSRIGLHGMKGKVEAGKAGDAGTVNAAFLQIGDATGAICEGEMQPRRCGWFARDRHQIVPTPAVRYNMTGHRAEFLWIVGVGARDVQASREDEGVGLEFDGERYRIRFTEDVGVVDLAVLPSATTGQGSQN